MDGGTAKAIMWLGLALLFAAGGVGFGYAMWRVGRILRGAQHDLHRTVDEIVPIIVKAGVGMDQVNDQLGKVDVMLDSAVDMTEAIDTTVRAVSHAVTEPVRAVSTTMAGAAEAARSFRDRVSGTAREDAADDVADAAAPIADAEAPLATPGAPE
ncbi:MAG: hypothetical protein JWM90_1932 [Thermoleophilia bacterium]|nr:hypothetical protein [Thermoleophilia bacterium]